MANKIPASLMKDGTPNILFGKDANGDPTEHTIATLGAVDGFILSNDLITPLTDIVISAGIKATTDDLRVVELLSDTTKSLASTWVAGDGGGLDTGVIAADSSYAVHIIENDTTDAIDILLSLSFTTPTLPVGWSVIRRIGFIMTNPSVALHPFQQTGRKFVLGDLALDRSINLFSTINTVSTLPPIFLPPTLNISVDYLCRLQGGNGGVYIRAIGLTTDISPASGDYLWVADANGRDANATIMAKITLDFNGSTDIRLDWFTTYDGTGGARSIAFLYIESWIDHEI